MASGQEKLPKCDKFVTGSPDASTMAASVPVREDGSNLLGTNVRDARSPCNISQGNIFISRTIKLLDVGYTQRKSPGAPAPRDSLVLNDDRDSGIVQSDAA